FLADRSVAFAGRGVDATVTVAVAALLLTVRVGRSRHTRADDRARGRADQRAFRIAADGLPEERAACGAGKRSGSRALLRRRGRAAGEHGCKSDDDDDVASHSLILSLLRPSGPCVPACIRITA